ncbi:MAG: MerR family transcriptional regulator [Lachnospiraceae bacterium]|jgi:DNA-binding transcriptional MerR regulator|nr:MerR family transcriptional regulator [Lachnospiraceae bacterium]MCI9599230.1 MerR family transcriptional regulator [Lachnospiraceae bacterium]MDE6896456.1 MerR family transcriptional regulator [Lachnospiraceae bacterium]
MTISEVSEKFGITQDTLRYYEKAGIIPRIARTPGGVRDYQPEDLGWIEHVVCLRNAGMPVESLVEYLRLSQQGDDTFSERLELLKEQKENLKMQQRKLQDAMDRLDFKISRYQAAVETGRLSWDDHR